MTYSIQFLLSCNPRNTDISTTTAETLKKHGIYRHSNNSMKINKKIRSIISSKLHRQTNRKNQNRIRQQQKRKRNKHKNDLQNSYNKKLPLPTLITTNIRSLNNKIELFSSFILDAKPDIFCLNETWANENSDLINNNRLELDNIYHILSIPRHKQTSISKEQRTRTPGGGISTLISTKYSSKPPTPIELPDYNPISHHFTIEPKDQKLELSIIRLYPDRLPRGYTICLVANVYIPEFIDNKQKQLIYQLKDLIQPVFSKFSTNGKPLLFLMGDFNGANTNPLIKAFDLYQINSLPTNQKDDKCIDIILTNAPKSYNTINLPPIGTSDHKTVLARPDFNKYTSTKPKQLKIQVRSAKIADTVAGIRIHNWSPLESINNTQEAYNYFYSTISVLIDQHQPLKYIKVGLDKPWMTPKLKSKIQTRQLLYKQLEQAKINNKTQIEVNNLEIQFKKQQHVVVQHIKSAKIKYNRRYTSNNPDFWKAINDIKSGKKVNTINKQDAENINEAFYGVWNGIKQPDISTFIVLDCPKPDIPIFNATSINSILNKLRPTSSGPDELSPILLKSARLELSQIIADLANLSISNAYVPDQHKKSNITPIAKIPFPTNPLDFRPISNLSVFDKIIQKGIANKILSITQDLMASNKQYGFLPN